MPGTALSNPANLPNRPVTVKEASHSAHRLPPAVAAPIDMSTTCPELARISGTTVHFAIIDEPYQARPLESHGTGRALMQALRGDPAAPNAATRRQAWALSICVGGIFLAFLVGWTFFGLPAPEMPQ